MRRPWHENYIKIEENRYEKEIIIDSISYGNIIYGL